MKPPIHDSEHIPAGKPRNLALGIERIGLIALRFPIAIALVFVILLGLAAVGFERLKVDNSLSQLFRSDTPEYKDLRRGHASLSRRASTTCWSSSKAMCLAREALEKLRDAAIDLQLAGRHPRHHLPLLRAGSPRLLAAAYRLRSS